MNASIRLLLVEDESTTLAALRKFFNDCGYHVDCAGELEEAEALIAVNDYDVVIADIRLSSNHSTQGLEVIRFSRRVSRHTHVIILSAHASQEIRESAGALGADAFLTKPTALPLIAETVAQVLGRTL